ncbi:MAG: ATP-binding protein [Sandaracinaceae bacterium]
MTARGALWRWLVAPRSAVIDAEDRRHATLYAAFILVISATGLTLGYWIFPASQGATDLSETATWRAALLATFGFAAAYGLARFGRLEWSARILVGTAAVCAFLASLEEPRILLFINSAVVIASATLPLRGTLLTALFTAASPALLAWMVPGVRYADLVYIQGVNCMLPALLVLAGWYREQLVRDRQQRDARLAALVRSSPDGILRIDDAGRIAMCNPAMETLSGRTAHELLGQTLSVLGLEDVVAAGVGAETTLSTGRMRQASGVERRVECLVWRADDAMLGGGIQVVVRDVEEREQLQRQLEDARRLEALGRLAGGIAHDINNQLTVILGSADFLSQGHSEEDIQAISRAADHSQRLVAQLLTFARGDASALTPLNLGAVVTELQPILRSLAREHVDIVVDAPFTGSAVLANRTQLEQVVINLVANASDAMPGGGTLAVRVSERTIEEPELGLPPGTYAQLEVSDEGEGIDAELAGRIFDPFFTTKEEGEGTGLGLATVHGIVTRAGGHVSASPREGGGTCFQVLLPTTDHPARDSAPPADALGLEWKGKRVLVVDDQVGVGELVARVLSRVGCETQYVREPFDAIALVNGGKEFDLLVTDVVMPRLSGPELARRLRSLIPGLRVVMMTGYAQEEDLTGERVLPKPFSPAQLRAHCAAALAPPDAPSVTDSG